MKDALTDVYVSPFFGSKSKVSIGIERDVKQGDPLSPLLFITCYDPLLHKLSSLSNISTMLSLTT